MRSVKLSFWLIAWVGVVSCLAQNPNPGMSTDGHPVREPQAMAAVEQALAGLGGKAANLQVRTAVIRGSFQLEGDSATSSFLWEDDLSGKVPEFRKEIHSGDKIQTFVSGHGAPAHTHDGAVRPLSLQIGVSALPFYLPGIVLSRELGNPDYSFQVVNDSSGFIHVRTSLELNAAAASITPQDWYFDATTKMPVRVQYLLPSNHRFGRPKGATLDLSDFRNVSGITIPFRIVTHGLDSKSRTATVADVEVNGAIDRTHFELSGSQQ